MFYLLHRVLSSLWERYFALDFSDLHDIWDEDDEE